MATFIGLIMNSKCQQTLLILEKLHGQKYPFESLYQVNQSLAFEWQNKTGSKP